MKIALAEAEKGAEMGEVPVGAVLVSESGQILAASPNRTISLADPSAHAEILALRIACQKIKNYRLLNTTLYVTIEPCIMCMGAIIHARVGAVIYGAPDPKWGGAGSLYNLATDNRLNHHPEIMSGICENECRKIIQTFFRAKRKQTVKP
jgi:tRNA(adenine34) deaminase